MSTPVQDSKMYLTRFFRAIMAFQIKNRYVGNAFGKITNIEQQILTEIDGARSLRLTDLARRLMIPNARASQIISKLSTQGLVESRNSATDKRESRYSLKAKGAAIVKETDSYSDYMMGNFTSRLTDEECQMLHHGLVAFADALSAPAIAGRSCEHPLRVQIRRVTRALKILTSGFVGSGLSNPEAHVLSVLSQAEGLSAKETAHRLFLPVARITMTLAALEKRKLVMSRKSGHSPKSYSNSEHGLATLRDTERLAVEDLISRFSPSFFDILPGLLEVYEKAVLIWNPQIPFKGFRCKQIETYFERSIARSLVLETALRFGSIHFTLESLSPEKITFIAYQADTVIAVAYGQLLDEGIEVDAFGIVQSIDDTAELRSAILSWISGNSGEKRVFLQLGYHAHPLIGFLNLDHGYSVRSRESLKFPLTMLR